MALIASGVKSTLCDWLNEFMAFFFMIMTLAINKVDIKALVKHCIMHTWQRKQFASYRRKAYELLSSSTKTEHFSNKVSV